MGSDDAGQGGQVEEKTDTDGISSESGALYGVEIWGWKRREELERMQGRFVKMALKVACNMPDYLRKVEAGDRSIEVELQRRVGAYTVKVLKMKEGRSPKVCLKEEIRGIINGNPSRWGAEFRDAMREVVDGRTVELIRAGTGGVKIIEKYLMEGVKRKKEQDTQSAWVRADKSTCANMKMCKYLRAFNNLRKSGIGVRANEGDSEEGPSQG